MKKYFSIALLTLSVSLNVQAADISPSKKQLIDTLLEQTGQSAITVGKQFSNLFTQQIITFLKQTKPDIDPKAFTIVEEEINALLDEEMVQNGSFQKTMYPIYNRHFTEPDLEEMIRFNDTALGRKIIRVMPAITQESMQAGQTLGRSLGPKIQERIAARLKAEGIE
ncbi:MAG: DUF2059 domain-containing protein [Marinobacterium sp.]|nr:DUF2059 domain-containing protein [Marinobacterium sp.]